MFINLGLHKSSTCPERHEIITRAQTLEIAVRQTRRLAPLNTQNKCVTRSAKHWNLQDVQKHFLFQRNLVGEFKAQRAVMSLLPLSPLSFLSQFPPRSSHSLCVLFICSSPLISASDPLSCSWQTRRPPGAVL